MRLSLCLQGARGEICGGFSDVAWDKTSAKGHYISAEKAFLFTLTNNQDVPPTKYDLIKKPFAICYHPEYVIIIFIFNLLLSVYVYILFLNIINCVIIIKYKKRFFFLLQYWSHIRRRS